MEKIRTILIDSDAFTREKLKTFALRNKALVIIAIYASAIEAKKQVLSDSVDLIISDIQMPYMDGITFLKSLENPPFFIFITGYPEYAIEGFELNVVDYILKSTLSDERLGIAVQKVNKFIDYKKLKNQETTLMFKDGAKTFFVNPKDICSINSFGDYVKITTNDALIIVRSSLKALEVTLPKEFFVRIHRSHIIPVRQIKSVNATQVSLKNGELLKIGLHYRERLFNRLGIF